MWLCRIELSWEFVALDAGQISYTYTFGHYPSLRDLDNQMVDAPPGTLPVTALKRFAEYGAFQDDRGPSQNLGTCGKAPARLCAKVFS
jgi:hypothetical protein